MYGMGISDTPSKPLIIYISFHRFDLTSNYMQLTSILPRLLEFPFLLQDLSDFDHKTLENIFQ